MRNVVKLASSMCIVGLQLSKALPAGSAAFTFSQQIGEAFTEAAAGLGGLPASFAGTATAAQRRLEGDWDGFIAELTPDPTAARRPTTPCGGGRPYNDQPCNGGSCFAVRTIGNVRDQHITLTCLSSGGTPCENGKICTCVCVDKPVNNVTTLVAIAT